MILVEDTFVLYSARHYDNPNCQDLAEFYTDLAIPSHLKKLFTRYNANGVLKKNLIVNHLICFFNVFKPLPALKILFFKIDAKHHTTLKTFLIYMQRLEETTIIPGLNIQSIPIDIELLRTLQHGDELDQFGTDDE